MEIFFGLQFDDQVLHDWEATSGGQMCVGPQAFLQFMEMHLGLSGHANNVRHLRIEQCRQIVQDMTGADATVFFAQSFEADPLATADTLLEMRDELLLAGWDFSFAQDSDNNTEKDVLPRLQALAELEKRLRLIPEKDYVPGIADRMQAVSARITDKKIPIDCLYLREPKPFFPAWVEGIVEEAGRYGHSCQRTTIITSSKGHRLRHAAACTITSGEECAKIGIPK